MENLFLSLLLGMVCPFAISVVNQFIQSLYQSLECYHSYLRYLKKALGQSLLYEDKMDTQTFRYCDVDWEISPMDRCSATRYCIFIGGNIISWKSKKQTVVARSSVEVEYSTMVFLTCELVLVKQCLKELIFSEI